MLLLLVPLLLLLQALTRPDGVQALETGDAHDCVLSGASDLILRHRSPNDQNDQKMIRNDQKF